MKESYSKYSDRELVDLLKQDDVEALNEVHARFSLPLYAHAYKRYPYREEVRDLVQELFIYLWDNRKQLLITTGLEAYLYTSVRNKLLSNYRKKKVRDEYASSLQTFIEQESNTTEEEFREKELKDIIAKELAALPPQMKLIFDLSRNKSLSHQEIAQQLGLSPHTIRTQIRNTLRILRVKLGANMFSAIFI
jgi:RNA polymerase sigma-70 factor (family 1)